jgi:hypothetical protein
MIVPHKPERAPNHRILKEDGPIHCRNFARQFPGHSEMPGAPDHVLPQTDQPRSNTLQRDGLLTRMDVSGKMHLYTPRQIEASFNRRVNPRDLFDLYHGI